MMRSKTMSPQHVIDEEAQQLLRSILPSHWRLRPYQPDYGLDFTLELFQPAPTAGGSPNGAFETLGEHLFIQLKGARQADRARHSVYARTNVERFRYKEDREILVGEIETLPISIESSELVTVQRMGVGLPVLLIRADLDQDRCYFVCLSDYIDKILIPRHGNEALSHSRTIHIPAFNNLSDNNSALQWYGKRTKLYAAFQNFVYQQVELAWCDGNQQEQCRLAKHCAGILLGYDFWDNTPMWGILAYYSAALRRLVETESPGLTHINMDEVERYAQGDPKRKQAVLEWMGRQEISQLWQSLAVLPRNYEEVCREWFLPTDVGLRSTFSSGTVTITARSSAGSSEGA